MFRLALVWAFCLLCVGVNDHASARPIHGGIANGAVVTCPQGGGANDNGCAAAPANGQYINASFFTTAPQSGQAAYSTRPPWNVAGVDYAIGPTTPIGSETSSTTINTSNHPGCSQDSTTWAGIIFVHCEPFVVNLNVTINSGSTTMTVNSGTTTNVKVDGSQTIDQFCNGCNHPKIIAGSPGGPYTLDQAPTQNGANVAYSNQQVEVAYIVDLEGYDFNDQWLWVTHATGGSPLNNLLILKNDYIHESTTMCANSIHNGTGGIRVDGSDYDIESSKFYNDTPCDVRASLYKRTIDPGLTTQANFTVSIASGVATVSANTGTIAVGQYVYYGVTQVNTYRILSMVSGDNICTNSGCNTEQLNLGLAPVSSPVIDSSLTVAGGTAASTGPIEATYNQAVAGGENITSKYNVNLGMNYNATSGWGNADRLYNYSDMNGNIFSHSEDIAKESLPPSWPWTIDHFNATGNTIFSSAYVPYGTGTANIAMFTINSENNALTGGDVINTTMTADHNTLIANKSQYSNQTLLAPSNGYNNVMGVLVYDINQANNGAACASMTASSSGNTLNVTAVSSGTITVGCYWSGGTGAAPGVTQVGQIQAYGTNGTTGVGSTGTYSFTGNAQSAGSGSQHLWYHPGQVGTLNETNNYLDGYGANSCIGFDTGSPTTTFNQGGNISLKDGSAVTLSGCAK